MYRLVLAMLVVACATGLSAQATLNISGTVNTGEGARHLIDIDFGNPGGIATISLSISGDSASEGINVVLIDLDQIAANGFGPAFDSGSDAGTAAVGLSVDSDNYTGVRQFLISVETSTGLGVMNYTGTLTAATLATGALVSAGVEFSSDSDFASVKRIHDRGVEGEQQVNSGGDPFHHEFLVDFGSPAQSIDFFWAAEGDIIGDVELHEVLANGTTTLLDTLTGAAADWAQNNVATSTSRTGIVRFRIVADTADLELKWFAIFPSSVSVAPYGSITMTGSLNPNQERIHRVNIDFGANTNSVMLQLAAGTVTGTGDVNLGAIDRSVLATLGSAQAVATQFDGAFHTLSYTGVQQFLFAVSESVGGNVNYSITFEFATSAVTANGAQAISEPTGFTNILDMGVTSDVTLTAGSDATFEFEVNFGATAQLADFFFDGGGTDTGDVEIFEILANGTAQSLLSLSWVGNDDNSGNDQSTLRSGVVRFRVVVSATNAGDFSFTVIFDDNVTANLIAAPGKKKDDSGCSTGDSSSHWLALFGALALMGLATRLRASRA